MSLFGSPDVPTTTIPQKSLSVLFGDDSSVPGLKPSMFNEDKESSHEQWKLPVSDKSQRKELMMNLQPSWPIPEYNEIFNTMSKDSDDLIVREEVLKVLDCSGLNSDQKLLILKIIYHESETTRLTRNEFNVLLALIGLAQDYEDISLEKIYEKRQHLPLPNLSGQSRPSISNPNIEESTIKSSRQRINPKSPNSRNFYDIPDADPWASSLANQNQHVAYTEVNAKQEEMDKEYSIPFKATQNAINRPSNNPVEIFAQPKKKVLDHTRNLDSINNNFTSQKSVQQSINENKSGYSSTGKYLLKASSPLGGDQAGSTSTEETILVKLQPEKEGVFMFQHHCYDIISARRGTKAVRRFSDFVWLLDYLQRRYPFRQIPLLPPKRIGVNGNHLAADSSFIEKRRRGLSRFANSLIRHPVLSKELLVIRFLTQPTEFSLWRKQAGYSFQDEFNGKLLPHGLEDSLPPNLDDLFARTRAGICKSAEIFISLCILIDRLARRNEGFAVDHKRISHSLQLLGDVCRDTYSKDTHDIPLLNDTLIASAKRLTNSQILILDEANSMDQNTLEDLKRQRDSFVSMRDLFDRRDQYDKDNIPFLERRIEKNQKKLKILEPKAMTKREVKSCNEIVKVTDEIIKDKESIISQQARRVFVKKCIYEELSYFQQTQYHISRWSCDWALERVKYSELQVDNWKKLNEELESVLIG